MNIYPTPPSILSPGQQRVWQIATEILEEFKINPIQANEDQYPLAYDCLLDRLCAEPVVQEDSFTGCQIADMDLANSYWDWVSQNAVETIPHQLRCMNFNRMKIRGSTLGKWEQEPHRKVYEGGTERPRVTARAVFTLVKGFPLPDTEARMSHYLQSGVTEVATGNHRALAYKLTGVSQLPKTNVHYFEEARVSEPLNQALLLLEGLAPRERFYVGTEVEPFLALAHEFRLHPLLADFAKHRIKNRSFWEAAQTPFDRLRDYVEDYYLITSEHWMQKIIRCLLPSPKEKDSEKQRAVSRQQLEQWLKNGHA